MKLLNRLFLLSLFGWGSVFAQSNLPACQGSDTTAWSNCTGTKTFPNGDKYVGEHKDGKFNGQGTGTFANGNKYVGEHKDGKFNGQGTYTIANGNKYVGEFKDGKYNGQGTYTFPNGNKYVGEFKDDKPNGQGTNTFANGNKYVGDYKDGKFNGLGTYTFANSSKYKGEFKDGSYNGQGIFYESNGSIINQGIWVDNTFVRSATVQQASVANQAVSVASTQPNAALSNLPACKGSDTSWCYGILNFPNGARYEGEFKEGIRFGRGIEFDHRGNYSRNGYWNDWQFSTTPFGSLAPTVSNIPDPSKAERDRLAADLEASRKKQQELEEQLRASQAVATQNTRPALNAPTERRVALVIGNATYKVNPLKNPVNDSTDMARSLRSVGFDVIEANNTTLAQMREVTRRFADKLGNSDVSLVYYSGHGVEVKGKNYLIPVNADIKREYEVVDQAFDASQFLEMMDNIRGPNNKRVNILIVDACRNNELQRSWRSTNNGLARMDAPGGTFISFATAPGRVAADGVGRNSPYTKHLLQALKQPNVPIEQVFKVVRRNVMEETKGEQIPWENSSLVGDFYFTVQR